MNLDELHDRHRDADIYVLASGPTSGHIDRDFYRGKIVVAVNRAAERNDLYRTDAIVYTHTHYHEEDAYPLAEEHPDHLFITPEGEQGHAGTPERHDLPNVIHYPHRPTSYDFNVYAAWPPPGGLLVGSTSTHGAMHLACHLGARTVILIGADCGTIDGHTNEPGYTSGNLNTPNPGPWLARWDEHLRAVAAKLRHHYGVAIHSLNPWVNLNLEGHTWQGTRPQTRGVDTAEIDDPRRIK
jgi:hypothetical protein